MSASIAQLAEGTRQRVEAWRGSLRDAQIPHQVTSTRRSRAEQTRLYERFLRGESDLPAAAPGTSLHELGRAVDVVFETEDDLLDAVTLAEDFGLRWGGDDDPVHFEDTSETVESAFRERSQITLPSDVTEALQALVPTTALKVGTSIVRRIFGSFLGLGDHVCCKR